MSLVVKKKVKKLIIARVAVDNPEVQLEEMLPLAALDVKRNRIIHLKVYPASF